MCNGSSLRIPDDTSFRACARPPSPVDKGVVTIRIDAREQAGQGVVFVAWKVCLPAESPHQVSHNIGVAKTLSETGFQGVKVGRSVHT